MDSRGEPLSVLTPLTGVGHREDGRRPQIVPYSKKRGVSRRASQNKSPKMLQVISKYLSSHSNVTHMAMPIKSMTYTHCLSANGIFSFNSTGLGPGGYCFPEHPGRSVTTYNAMSGAGVLQNTEWTHYAALYDEFKVLALLIEYVPGTQTFTAQNEFYLLADYDNEVSAGSLTTTNLAARYQTAKLLSPTQEAQFVAKFPSGRAFPIWQSTQSTTARGSVYACVVSGANATPFGAFTAKWICSFRNLNG